MTPQEFEQQKAAAEEILKIIYTKIPQLAALALEKNKSTNKAIFFDMAGHVNKLYFSVCKGKDKPDFLSKIFETTIKLEVEDIIDEQMISRAKKDLEKLNNCIEFLNNLE